MSQKQQKLKVIIHAFGISQGRAPNATGCLLGPSEVIGKDSVGLERIYGCLYVHFEAISRFTRNEQMGVYRLFEAIQMVPSTRPMLQVTSALPGTFREKI